VVGYHIGQDLCSSTFHVVCILNTQVCDSESKKVTGTGQVEGHRKQGKPRMRWLDSIKEATGLRLEDLREAVQDRKKWRTLVEEKTWNIVRTNVK
jgi:hypothetical protein